MSILECEKAKSGSQDEDCDICPCDVCEHEYLTPFCYEEGKEVCKKGCKNCKALEKAFWY